MANKNNIVGIPLNGELCLNKNKVDITQFTGWNKVNAPIYGGCLSPLYRLVKAHSNIWDKNGNGYNVTETVIEKNGVNVMSFNADGFKKEFTDLNYMSFDVDSTDVVYGIKEGTTSGQFVFCKLENGTETTKTSTLYQNGTVLKTKVKICEDGTVVFAVIFVTTAGYKLYCRTWNGTSTILESFTMDFQNPGIQIISANNKILITVYSNFAANQTECNTINYCWDKGTNLYKNTNLVFNCIDSATSINSAKQFSENAMVTSSLLKVNLAPVVRSGVVTINLQSPWESTISVYAFAPNQEITVKGGVFVGNINAGETSKVLINQLYQDSDNIPDIFNNKKWAIKTSVYDPATNSNITKVFPVTYGNVYYPDTIQKNYTETSKQELPGFYFTVKQTVTTAPVLNVNAVMDNGKLYSLKEPDFIDTAEKKIKNGGELIFQGEVNNISVSGGVATVNYNSSNKVTLSYIDGDSSAAGPQYFEGMNISLNQEHANIVYNFVSGNKETPYNFRYDSTFDSITYGGGVDAGGKNLSGGDSNKNHWRILFNNGYVSNISYFDAEGYIGTILADWNSIDDNFEIVRAEGRLYYKSSEGVIYKVSVSDQKDWKYKFIENRYILVNTTSYYNCFDTVKGSKLHWGSDYNNRVNLGSPVTSTSGVPEYKSIIAASSQNGNYEITKDFVSSVQYGALVLYNVITGNVQFKDCSAEGTDKLSQINFYQSEGTESTVAYYDRSFVSGLYFKDPQLFDAYFPVMVNGNMLYNPNIFTEFVTTYNNKDMVRSDGISYNLMYSGANPVFLFQMLAGIEGLKDVFALQTQYYGITEDKIFSLSFSDGIAILGDVAANINGMQYLGALPTKALFYSPMNRSIYAFGGDAILMQFVESNEIDTVYKTWYNTATQTLYIATNNGLYIFSDNFIYKLDFFDVETVFFTDDGHSIINTQENSSVIAYNQEENFEAIPLDIETKFFGIGNNQTQNFDCWYIKLFNNFNRESGKVVLTCSTVTDKGTETQKKEIAIQPSMWDKNSDYIYLRFQPAIQKGIGAKISVQTKFPIIDMAVGYTVFDGNAQISHVNG